MKLIKKLFKQTIVKIVLSCALYSSSYYFHKEYEFLHKFTLILGIILTCIYTVHFVVEKAEELVNNNDKN